MSDTPRRMLNEQIIRQALSGVKYPGYSRDIVSFGLLKQIVIRDDAVGVLLQLTTNSAETALQIKQAAEAAIAAVPGVKHADVEVKTTAAPAATPATPPKQTPSPSISPARSRISATTSACSIATSTARASRS
jgi:ATP-binding protein involved in chromosome partitioning